jgi:HAD superfamily hydrolase (TIGR01490 family)
MTAIAIFDLDRTLTRRPTYTLFLLHAMRRLAPWRLMLLPVLLPVAAAYAARLIRRETMKEAMHWVALGRQVPKQRIAAIAEDFAERLHRQGLYPQATALIAELDAAGTRLVLATAAPALYAVPLARRLKIADIVATTGEEVADGLTHRIAGANCYGPEKLRMIEAALAAQGIDRAAAHVSFYTDHVSDQHVCDWADAAYAVNPSPRMAALAHGRGWPVLDWRKG